MNANELADKLQELDSKLHLIELFKAATMLRQQQVEIETYKLELYDEVMLRREQKAKIEALEAEIEALKRKWLDACDGIIEVKQRYEKAQEK